MTEEQITDRLRTLYTQVDVYEDELDHCDITDERYFWLRREIKSLDREIADLVESPETAA